MELFFGLDSIRKLNCHSLHFDCSFLFGRFFFVLMFSSLTYPTNQVKHDVSQSAGWYFPLSPSSNIELLMYQNLILMNKIFY